MNFRSGTQVDSTSLALILDSAGRRLPSYVWSLYADDGQSFFEFGREKIRTEVEANSYCCNWHIGESDNKFIGAFYGFSVENPYPEIDYEKIIAVLVEAVKDQQTQIDELKRKIK